MTVLEASGHIRAGKLRALAVTSDKRVAALPDVPTLGETVAPGFNSISWIGLLAPAGDTDRKRYAQIIRERKITLD